MAIALPATIETEQLMNSVEILKMKEAQDLFLDYYRIHINNLLNNNAKEFRTYISDKQKENWDIEIKRGRKPEKIIDFHHLKSFAIKFILVAEAKKDKQLKNHQLNKLPTYFDDLTDVRHAIAHNCIDDLTVDDINACWHHMKKIAKIIENEELLKRLEHIYGNRVSEQPQLFNNGLINSENEGINSSSEKKETVVENRVNLTTSDLTKNELKENKNDSINYINFIAPGIYYLQLHHLNDLIDSYLYYTEIFENQQEKIKTFFGESKAPGIDLKRLSNGKLSLGRQSFCDGHPIFEILGTLTTTFRGTHSMKFTSAQKKENKSTSIVFFDQKKNELSFTGIAEIIYHHECDEELYFGALVENAREGFGFYEYRTCYDTSVSIPNGNSPEWGVDDTDWGIISFIYCGFWKSNVKHGLGFITSDKIRHTFYLLGYWENNKLVKIIEKNDENWDDISYMTDRHSDREMTIRNLLCKSDDLDSYFDYIEILERANYERLHGSVPENDNSEIVKSVNSKFEISFNEFSALFMGNTDMLSFVD